MHLARGKPRVRTTDHSTRRYKSTVKTPRIVSAAPITRRRMPSPPGQDPLGPERLQICLPPRRKIRSRGFEIDLGLTRQDTQSRRCRDYELATGHLPLWQSEVPHGQQDIL